MSFIPHTFGLAMNRQCVASRPCPTGPWNQPLSAHSRLQEGCLVIEVVGDLTLRNQPVFAAALSGALDALPPLPVTMVVDLRRVDRLDNSGLALLVGLSKCLRSPDAPRAPRILVRAGRQPECALRLGQYGKILEIIPDAVSESCD